MEAYELYARLKVADPPFDRVDRRLLKERRKQRTRAFSRFVINGKRRSFRRREDRAQGGYVDRYGSGLFFLIVLIAGLNLLDALFTMMILDSGGWEVNPIVRSVIQLYGNGFWVWKFVVVSASLTLLCLHTKFRLAAQAILGVGIIYAAVISFQLTLVLF